MLSVVGVAGWPVILTAGRLAGDGACGRSGRGRHTLRCHAASQQQTLSGTGARVCTAHRGWLVVVTGVSAA